MKPKRFRSMLIMAVLLIFTGCGLTMVHEDRYRGHNWDDYGYTQNYDGGYYSHRMDHDDGYYSHRMGHNGGYYGHRMDSDGDFDGHR